MVYLVLDNVVSPACGEQRILAIGVVVGGKKLLFAGWRSHFSLLLLMCICELLPYQQTK